jgi:hypothetical protein
MRRLFAFLVLLSLPLYFAPLTMAQNNASIVGVVTDPSGAAMPNVKITVSNQAQALVRTLNSDSVGAYKVGFLPIGMYTVVAEMPGFQKYLQTEIKLEIGQVQRVDITMQVGTTTQEITVTGNVVKVQTDESVLSSVVAGNQIAAININGRNFVALSTLLPGAAVTNAYDPTLIGQNVISYVNFNGTTYAQSDWQADGGNLYNWNANGNYHGVPGLDTIAEFKISTSNYTADQGIRMGAVIEMSTKSGTRAFHGDAFEYVRNDVWDANPWFVNQQLWSGMNAAAACGGNAAGPCNAPKTPLKLNDFGFTIGGPLTIPGHYNTDKSKTFVFWSSEWKRLRTGTTLTSSAPTARMRGGDFSECDSTSANYNKLISNCVIPKNPANGNKPFTGDLVPVSTQAADLLNTWVPPANNGPTGWIDSPSIPINWNQQMLRVDQNFGDKTRLYVRVSRDQDWTSIVPALYSGSTFDSVITNVFQTEYNWAGHFTHTFRPNIVNDFMYHYDDKVGPDWNEPGPGWNSNVLTKPADWSMNYLFPQNASQPMMPTFSVNGGGLKFSEGLYYYPYNGLEWNEQYSDNLAITHGNHNFKTGIMMIRGGTHITQTTPGALAQGTVAFDTGSTITTGNGMADMLLGREYSYTEGSAANNGTPVGGYLGSHWYVVRLEPYVQDDWRVTRRLTVNLGVRAFWLEPWQDQGAAWNLKWHGVASPYIAGFEPNLYNAAVQAPLNASGNITPNAATGQIYDFKMFGNGIVHCGQNGIPSGCQNTQPVHFAPRFGFAWQPFSNPNTVIRGGFGIFYDQLTGNDTNPKNIGGNNPVFLSSSANNTIGWGSTTPGAFGPASENNLAMDVPYPRAEEFSLGFQREMKGNNRLAINYVGTMVKHNPRSMALNRISIGTNTVNVPALAGTTDCDASGNCDVQASLINQKHSINFFRPYQGYAGISRRETSASSEYQGLQAELRHPMGHGLTLEAAYTFSKWMDDADSYSADPNINDDLTRRYWARSGYNRTNVAVFQYVYDVPFLKNNSNRYVKNAFGGWQVTGVTSFFSGLPVNFGCSVSGYGNGTGSSNMCNSLAPMVIAKSVDNNPTYGPMKQWYNPQAVGQIQQSQLSANNQPGMFGWMGINQLTGPGRNNWDLALLKNFSTPWFRGEHSTVQFRWETYNTFNHPEFSGISAGCGSTTPFGQPCNYATYTNANGTKNVVNAGQGDVNAAWPQRIMQFGLKFIF